MRRCPVSVILVCGGRTYGEEVDGKPIEQTHRERHHVYHELYARTAPKNPEYMLPDPETFIKSGAARGADSVAIDWAVVNWVRFREYPADWDRHGRGAGFIRNQEMLDDGKTDFVLAFPGGRGTEDMVRRALKAGVKVIRCKSIGNSEELRP